MNNQVPGKGESVEEGAPPGDVAEAPVRAARRRRRSIAFPYVLTCLAIVAVVFTATTIHREVPFGRAAYAGILLAICAAPFFLGRHNPGHRLMSIFMGCYFLLFGMGTAIAVLTGDVGKATWGSRLVSGLDYVGYSDFAVVGGVLCFLGGYFLWRQVRGQRASRFLGQEWRYGTVLKAGFGLWLVGFIFQAGYDMTVSVFVIPTHVLGIPTNLASNLRLLAPLGSAMLAYLVTRGYRPVVLWPVLAVMMLSELTLGFIASSKEVSFRIAVLLVLATYYATGKVRLKMVLALLAVAVPYMLFFNAYRMQMMEGGFMDPLAAFEKFERNIDVVKSKTKGEESVIEYGLRSLSSRVDGKVYVDIIATGTESGKVPFLHGESLGLFFTSFIPRALWPGKPETTTGQAFNRAFGLSASSLTYVPTTQVGDLYWNFGLPAVIVGMFAIGIVFAQLSTVVWGWPGMTLPRFLILIMATYFLALKFEGNISAQYSIFVRLLVLIWLIDRFFRRGGVARQGEVRAAPAQAP